MTTTEESDQVVQRRANLTELRKLGSHPYPHRFRLVTELLANQCLCLSVPGQGNAGSCCGSAVSQGVDDVGFVNAMIDAVDAAYCVDPKRVYAAGFSNGGMLSNRLACELGDRVAVSFQPSIVGNTNLISDV